MEIYIISNFKYKFFSKKIKIIHFVNVETDPSLRTSKYNHFTKNTPLLAPWIFLNNIQNPLLHFEVPSTKENHTSSFLCEHENIRKNSRENLLS